MFRPFLFLLTTLLLISAGANSATAQIEVRKKPAPEVGPDEEVVYKWWSTWGCRSDPADKYPLGPSTHKTLGEARDAANAHMEETKGNGSLAVTHYLIEGEPKVRTKLAGWAEKAKDLLARLKEAKDAVDHAIKVANDDEPLIKVRERKFGDTIKEYKEMVQQSFERIAETKKTLTSGIEAQSEIQFAKVNKLIDQYNNEVSGFQSVVGKNATFGFTTMARLTKTMNPNPTAAGAPAARPGLVYSIYYRDREGDNEWGEWKSMLTTPIGVEGKTWGFKSEDEGKVVIDAIVKHRAKLREEFPDARHIDYEYKLRGYDPGTKKYVDEK